MFRYIGQTNFAPGEWAGVELEQPLGTKLNITELDLTFD